MFNWMRQKPRPPRLIIDIHQDHFDVKVEWPRAAELSDEDAGDLAQSLIGVSYLLTKTPVGLNRVIMAISNNAERTGDDRFGQYVVAKLMELGTSSGGDKQEKEGPLVGPAQAFGLKRTTKRSR